MLMTVGIGMYMHVADHDNYKLEPVIGEYTLGYFKDHVNHVKVSVFSLSKPSNVLQVCWQRMLSLQKRLKSGQHPHIENFVFFLPI